MSTPNNDLNQLIDSTRQDAHAQQANLDGHINKAAPMRRGKQVLSLVLVVILAVVLFYQYPRFSQPYAWPDPATDSSAAEGDLIELVSRIEAYRMAQGQYPAVLGQLALPEGLAAVVARSAPQYRALDNAYTLDWPLPHWRASYDSRTEKVSVQPIAKQ